jgi:hypothetical protein
VGALGLDPDGSGSLLANQNRITATVTQGGAPKAGVDVAYRVVSVSSGDDTDPDLGTNTFAGISGSDGKVSFVVKFNDVGGGGGSYTVRVWADLIPNGFLDPGEPSQDVTVQYVSVTVSVPNPSGYTVGDDAKDTTLTVTVTGPTGATLPLVAAIIDAFPAAGGIANASFAACDPLGSDGVDIKTGSSAPGSPFKADIWACDGVANDTFTVKVFWDVNGNGVADAGEDSISNTVTL